MFAAIRRASSRVSSLAADLHPGSFFEPGLILEIDISELLPGAVTDLEGRTDVLDGPGWWEAVSFVMN
jgi:hypothetical protein